MYSQEDVSNAKATLGIPEHLVLDVSSLKEYYLKTIKRVHPDAGGNDFLTKQVNRANDILNHAIKHSYHSRTYQNQNNQKQQQTNKSDQNTNQRNGQKSNYRQSDGTNSSSSKKYSRKSEEKSQQHKSNQQPEVSEKKSVLKWCAAVFLVFIIILPRLADKKTNTVPSVGVATEEYTSVDTAIRSEDVSSTSQIDGAMSEEDIAKETSILIKRINASGTELPLNQGWEPSSKLVITYKGKNIYSDEASSLLSLTALYNLTDSKLVVAQFSTGGNACPYSYRVVKLSNETASITPSFGSCTQPQIYKENNSLVFSFFTAYGKRKVVSYNGIKLSEKNISIPLNNEPGNKGLGFYYIQNYLDQQDIEGILINSSINPILRSMTDTKFDEFARRLEIPSIISDNNFFLIHGIAPHSGGTDEAFLAIERGGDHIYAGILETEFIGAAANSRIYLYSNQPAMFSQNLPTALNSWVKSFPDAFVVWKFGN